MNKEDLDYFLENSPESLHECIQDEILVVAKMIVGSAPATNIQTTLFRQSLKGKLIAEAIEAAVEGFVTQHKHENEGEQTQEEWEAEINHDRDKELGRVK